MWKIPIETGYDMVLGSYNDNSDIYPLHKRIGQIRMINNKNANYIIENVDIQDDHTQYQKISI